MRVKSKYKVAKRLGAAVFEKTQTSKYALRSERKKTRGSFSRPRSNYGKQLIEKQKVRFTYGLSEKQFSNYIKKVIDKNPSNPSELLFTYLEKRLDNIALRSGFAPTRFAARQMVSHGHLTVNGRKVTVPSMEIKEGDVIAIREGSKEKALFADLDDRFSETTVPAWISLNKTKREVTTKGQPIFVPSEQSFDLEQVLQFYKR